ncbi:hypothetical protein PFTANZ_02795 [Plasmodium falciparum Tanzania (2000708)]|uniref:DNA/RNA-binding protein Alba-like domain-containing protein n=1 Tax=Plasmodium falciparum Tanzania (2000708) TaxID=1036725 RepID=A0A024W7E8_PLAFA|nr:hypothetical protein PFTANZ_02795 [Plasmodium falciparum Tanzania (2000708)]
MYNNQYNFVSFLFLNPYKNDKNKIKFVLQGINHKDEYDSSLIILLPVVSMTKKPTFYARIGKRMFTGNEEKNPFDEVIITGLGNATKIAIGAASIMEKEDIGQIVKVQTAYFSSDRINRRIPKITIVLKKHPDFVAN